MKIHDCPQGSEEWVKLRAGRLTASEFKKILTPGGKLSKSSEIYMADLVGESFCPSFVKWEGNFWTDRGKELETGARVQFQHDHPDLDVVEVGFVTMNDVTGCSPDGLIYVDGELTSGIEIKCPAPGNHIRCVEAGEMPSKYAPQVHGSMIVTGLKQWTFMSYCPGMAPLYVTVEWDAYTFRLKDALAQFTLNYGEYKARMTPRLQPTNAIESTPQKAPF